MFELLNDNAGAIQGLATVALVVITWFYAAKTASISRATHDAVEQGRKTAEASQSMAEAAEMTAQAALKSAAHAAEQASAASDQADEARRSRALSVLPLVVARYKTVGESKLFYSLANQGIGPAVSIRVQWLTGTQGGALLDVLPALRPGEVVETAFAIGADEMSVIAAASNRGELTFRCIYMDVLGGEYESGTTSSNMGASGLNAQALFTLGDDK